MSNTIKEILEKKHETIFDTYKRALCSECINRENDKDLCNIVVNLENKAQCVNYERCIRNKCHGCSSEKECFEESEKTC